MKISISYAPKKIIPALDGGIDHGADQVVVTEFPQFDTQLIWQKGCKRWCDLMAGYVYESGNFQYQTVRYRATSNRGFNIDLTKGQWSDGLGVDEDRPKLDNRWVGLMLKKLATMADNPVSGAKAIPYAVVEVRPKYTRGKTMVIDWQDTDLDELHDSLANLGVL